jgi:molecular chaperone DnaJ
VKIPAGIANGQRLRLYGEGEHGGSGGPPGDLYVVVHVQDHPFFQREGDDLYCEAPVNYPTLALGGTVAIPTLIDGEETLTIPAGTQAGTRFKIRNKGMPNVSGRGKGDLFVIVRPTVPKKLTKEQKRLIEQLARTLEPEKIDASAPRTEADRPFFEKVKDIFG